MKINGCFLFYIRKMNLDGYSQLMKTKQNKKHKVHVMIDTLIPINIKLKPISFEMINYLR